MTDKKERLFVIQPIINDDYKLYYSEALSLIDTASAEHAGTAYQKIRKIDPATFIGSGKLEEISAEINDLNADTVLFNGDLSPSQVLNISKALSEIKVIDRTTLVLDIFARRAKTAEGKIQTELAQLRYIYPRLKGKGAALSRLGGGIGTRGPGETQLETDRRHIKLRIKNLEKQLEGIEKRRELQTYRRTKNRNKTIALVGYTNTGKSTLLNTLTKSDVFVEDKLFATLDPTLRKMLVGGSEVLITDTVGFISALPHHLIEAFKTTLESAKNSDLNLIVCDASANYNMQLEVTLKTLESMGCKAPYLIVINKSELIDSFDEYPKDAVYVSAKEKKGLDRLKNKIAEILG